MAHIQLLLFVLDCSVMFRHLDTTTQRADIVEPREHERERKCMKVHMHESVRYQHSLWQAACACVFVEVFIGRL